MQILATVNCQKIYTMTLEELTEQLNGSTFWKEFTFSQNQFSPHPGKELELADNVIWLGETLFVIQLKEREKPTDDPEAERRWFRTKVRNKACRQIKDSLRFLQEHENILITNGRGQSHEVRRSEIRHVEKIVIYSSASALPEDCKAIRSHVSRTAGFIHIFDWAGYSQVVKTLAVPEEVRRYLEFRQRVLCLQTDTNAAVVEADILGAYMSDEGVPIPTSHNVLSRLFDDAKYADLSPIMNRLADNIQHSVRGDNYIRILLEFAKLPRSAWRVAKERLDLAIEQAKTGQFERPYRFIFPESDCSFMFSSILPNAQKTGIEGEQARATILQSLTYDAKYLAKTSKGVGVLVSYDSDYFNLDWCLIEGVWEYNRDHEQSIKKSNLFSDVKEKEIYGYYFVND